MTQVDCNPCSYDSWTEAIVNSQKFKLLVFSYLLFYLKKYWFKLRSDGLLSRSLCVVFKASLGLTEMDYLPKNLNLYLPVQ